MTSTRHPLDTVRAAAEKFAAEADGGTFTLTAALVAVNTALNGRYDTWDHATEGQARRTLDAMAAAGALVKVGLHQPGPGGAVHHARQPVFYTPGAYAAAEADVRRVQGERAKMEARWAEIYGTLTLLDIHPVSERGQEVRLSSASWHKLLDMIAGRAPVPEAARSIMQ